MANSSDVPSQLAYRISHIEAEDLSDAVHRFLTYILETERELSELARQVSEISLSRTGYRTQQELDEVAERYHELNTRVDLIHRVMTTQRLGDINGIDSVSFRDKSQLLDCIEEGTIRYEVDRIAQTATRIGQQIDSKTIAANSRMGITISLVAVAIALFSTLYAVLV